MTERVCAALRRRSKVRSITRPGVRVLPRAERGDERLPGLGSRSPLGILGALMEELDDRMGRAWEEAFRMHLRRIVELGQIAPDVVAVGAWWQESGQGELDAVVLAGRRREAVLLGEAKWARRVEAPPIERALMRKLEALPAKREPVRLAIAARERVRRPGVDTLVVSARDVFARAE